MWGSLLGAMFSRHKGTSRAGDSGCPKRSWLGSTREPSQFFSSRGIEEYVRRLFVGRGTGGRLQTSVERTSGNKVPADFQKIEEKMRADDATENGGFRRRSGSYLKR